MKRNIEKILTLCIGGAILGGSIIVFIVVFGSSLVGLLTMIIGFPLAFPMTTAFIGLCLAGLFVFHKTKRD